MVNDAQIQQVTPQLAIRPVPKCPDGRQVVLHTRTPDEILHGMPSRLAKGGKVVACGGCGGYFKETELRDGPDGVKLCPGPSCGTKMTESNQPMQLAAALDERFDPDIESRRERRRRQRGGLS